MPLVWGEQGLGDQILFAAMIPGVIERAGGCVFECDPRLVPIIRRSFPGAEVVPQTDPPSTADAAGPITSQIPMADLLPLIRPWEHPPAGYLRPDPARVAALKAELGMGRKLIGISWRSARARVGPRKSMPLELWGPVLENRDARFVVLQYGDTDEEIRAAGDAYGADIRTVPELDRFDDVDGMLALVSALDLVITTSNVTAHYAGALGAPCWLALQRSPLWYWGWQGARVSFYPSIRAYRQSMDTVWTDVAGAIARDLNSFLEN